MAWKSPITVFEQVTHELNEQRNNEILATLKTQYAIDVDKEELTKALTYSKEQYDKGYEDGKAEGYYEGYKACFEKICGNIEKIIE